MKGITIAPFPELNLAMQQAYSYHVRSPCATDLDGLLQVQAACYPLAMQEPAAVLLARIAQAGASSLVALDDNGTLHAYLFAYRSKLDALTMLDSAFDVAADGDTLYLHDLAVAPQAAGRGLARRLTARSDRLARAQALAWCALVSVQDSQGFWERLGYRVRPCVSPAARSALASYPAPALYMARSMAAASPGAAAPSLL